jgi:DNA-binding transcriptional regulator YiaG
MAKFSELPIEFSPPKEEDLKVWRLQLGSNLKKYRERVDLSQHKAARALGVSDQAVQNWEQGLRVPRGEYVAAMARLYKCKTSDFFKGVDI